MASSVDGASFYHVDIQSELKDAPCGVCKNPLGPYALAHFFKGRPHVFHKHCIFVWMKDNDACPECLEKISQPFFSFYHLFPDFEVSYPDTDSGRSSVIAKVVELYAFFLTARAHHPPVTDLWAHLGVMVDKMLKKDVAQEKVAPFKAYLTKEIENSLKDSSQRSPIHLNIHYGPEPRGILFNALWHAEIDMNQSYFPQHSFLSLRLDNKRIRLAASFSLADARGGFPEVRIDE